MSDSLDARGAPRGRLQQPIISGHMSRQAGTPPSRRGRAADQTERGPSAHFGGAPRAPRMQPRARISCSPPAAFAPRGARASQRRVTGERRERTVDALSERGRLEEQGAPARRRGRPGRARAVTCTSEQYSGPRRVRYGGATAAARGPPAWPLRPRATGKKMSRRLSAKANRGHGSPPPQTTGAHLAGCSLTLAEEPPSAIPPALKPTPRDK